MPEKNNFNGVDAQRLDQTIKSIEETPETARFKLRAQNKWIDGTHVFSVIKDFEHNGEEYTTRPKPFVVDADEPEIFLGADYGPNATEWVLHALASCLSATLIFQATKRNIPIQTLELDMEGDLDVQGVLGISDKVRNGFQNVRVTFRVKADAPPKELEELIEAAQNHSPVFDIVTNKVPVTFNVEAESTKKAA